MYVYAYVLLLLPTMTTLILCLGWEINKFFLLIMMIKLDDNNCKSICKTQPNYIFYITKICVIASLLCNNYY